MTFTEKTTAFNTIVLREVRRTFRLWVQTLLPAAMTTTLYFLIFGHLIGRRIGTMANLPYIDFIVPGLIMMTMLTASFNASVSAVFSAKFQRSIEEILISPMNSTTILASFMCVGIVRGVGVGIIVGIIALFFTHLTVHHPLFIIFIALLSCGIFSLMGVINALYARNFDHISIFPTFIITPLSYLGGIFYSLSILPPLWQKVALFNPIIYIISSFRYGFYSHADINLSLSLLFMLFLFLILFMLGHRLIRRRKGIAE